MRRTALLALLTALLLVPAATAQAQEEDRVEILRDCADDDILQGDFPASKMRDALNNMPAELEEYSKCRDILSREIARKTAVTKPQDTGDGGHGDAGGGTGSGGNGGGGGTASPDATATATAPQRTGKDVGVQVGPSTPEDWRAMDGAIEKGGDAVPINGRPISPATTVGRNGMPGSVLVVLVLLGAAGFTLATPFARRRVL